MKNKWLKRSLKLAGVAGLASALIVGTAFNKSTNYLHRVISRNVMSNTGFNETDNSVWFKPSTYLKRGKYSGFVTSLALSDPDDKLPLERKNIDFNAIYLGLEKNRLPKSKYKPTSLSQSDKIEFYSISDYIISPQNLMGNNLPIPIQGLERIFNLKQGEVLSYSEVANSNKNAPEFYMFTTVDLHRYTLSFGRDDEGIYSSLYDVWDFKADAGYFKDKTNQGPISKATSLMLPRLGKPIHFYDRFYWGDYGISKDKTLEETIKKEKMLKTGLEI